ncbi:hypothetical protein E4U47_006689, partial [Claviceps purpurea]
VTVAGNRVRVQNTPLNMYWLSLPTKNGNNRSTVWVILVVGRAGVTIKSSQQHCRWPPVMATAMRPVPRDIFSCANRPVHEALVGPKVRKHDSGADANRNNGVKTMGGLRASPISVPAPVCALNRKTDTPRYSMWSRVCSLTLAFVG